jgi:SAM-dependent methyltransferase
MQPERRPRQQEIHQCEPIGFRPETTTVWSFPERGSWATHDGSYRGNWSPYVPRNLLLCYTAPGDWVLDPFIGGGTTAVEAALLGRLAIAGDLSMAALSRTRDQLEQVQRHRPTAAPVSLLREDARALAVTDASMQLVLLHPPYADAIRYSADTAGDLSHLAAGPFIDQLRSVARDSLRVLAPGGRCALLMGDLRRRGQVVPLGFAAIQACRREGLVLEDLIIKQQHQTRMAGRWAAISTQRGFLLLAHEYLAVFRRPDDLPQPAAQDHGLADDHDDAVHSPLDNASAFGTTVWTLPPTAMKTALPELARQVFGQRGAAAEVRFMRTPQLLSRAGVNVTDVLSRWLDQVVPRVAPGGVLAVETRDVRIDGVLEPLGLEVCRALRRRRGMQLKVWPENCWATTPNGASAACCWPTGVTCSHTSPRSPNSIGAPVGSAVPSNCCGNTGGENCPPRRTAGSLSTRLPCP